MDEKYFTLIASLITNACLILGYFLTQHLTLKNKKRDNLRKYISDFIVLFQTRDLNDKKLPEDLIRYTSIIRLHLKETKGDDQALIDALNAAIDLLEHKPNASDEKYRKVRDGIYKAALKIINKRTFWSRLGLDV